jgi:hypothetical protein
VNVGGPEELAEQCLDAQGGPATELRPIRIDHRRSRHRDKQRATGSEESMKFSRKGVGLIHEMENVHAYDAVKRLRGDIIPLGEVSDECRVRIVRSQIEHVDP